jgi:hypothetical protein
MKKHRPSATMEMPPTPTNNFQRVKPIFSQNVLDNLRHLLPDFGLRTIDDMEGKIARIALENDAKIINHLVDLDTIPNARSKIREHLNAGMRALEIARTLIAHGKSVAAFVHGVENGYLFYEQPKWTTGEILAFQKHQQMLLRAMGIHGDISEMPTIEEYSSTIILPTAQRNYIRSRIHGQRGIDKEAKMTKARDLFKKYINKGISQPRAIKMIAAQLNENAKAVQRLLDGAPGFKKLAPRGLNAKKGHYA